MAVKGIGTDIVQVDRFEAQIKRSEALARRVLTDTELAIFSSHKQPHRFLAKRFAAKEAVSKALGTGIGRGVSFHHIEIHNDEAGQPQVTLSDGAKQRAELLGATTVFLSISDEREFATAMAVLE